MISAAAATAAPLRRRGKPHRYFFRLYAVDEILPIKAGASKSQLLSALQGHTLAEAELMGTYGR